MAKVKTVDLIARQVRLNNTVFEDLRFDLTTTKVGALDLPDYDYDNLGRLFPQDDATEIIYISNQAPHKMKLSTNFYPHIHWVQTGEDFPVWKIDYRWYDHDSLVPDSFTTLTVINHLYTYPGSGNFMQKSIFPNMNGSSINDVSSIFDIKLYRDDDIVTGDVLAKSFDMHYEIDAMGSDLLYTKFN